ncbi:replication protein [Acetobacteraceae bacterium AT-5844]|nr:replication protein [Acetobacteraceae bacterium AT-5844]
MGNVETQAFPRQVACGLRKLTANHLLAARLAERARGLPPGVKHPNQLLAALRRAAPYLGHHGLLPLIEALFRWTQPQDWAPEQEPIVWPSNEELSTALGCSERHVSRLIAAAIEARLIVAKDGSDRRRRGLRENGRILWAWGLNLRPMAGRYLEFQEAAQAGEEARRQCRILRREARAARQSLEQFHDFAETQGLEAGALAAWQEQAARLCANLNRIEDPAELETRVTALRALVAEGMASLEPAMENGNMSGSADSDVRPILLTKQPTDPEGTTVAAQEEARGERQPPSPPPAAHADMPETVPTLSPAELVRLAPGVASYLVTDQPHWGDVADAAELLAKHLGIPRHLYAGACQQLGRRGAAVAIAVISTKPPGYFHSAGPGGYLRGMLRRAQAGALHLERSIFGLRDARDAARFGTRGVMTNRLAGPWQRRAWS